ncbi:MAG: hypothetical protein LBJ20_02295 [Candidatus Methanoplasma sp.]|nr:hypothetical protein [Candidatus Methanoplasma sp.]
MATASVNERITGGMGIAAVIVFAAAMFAAASVKSDFSFGSGTLGDLTGETIFVIGCVISGAVGVGFSLLMTFRKAESKVFIGKVRGVLMALSGVALILLGLTHGSTWTVYLFVALISLSAVSDTFYNWVSEQKAMTLLSLFYTLVIVLTGVLGKTSDNHAIGFLFAVFVSFWVLFVAILRFIPAAEAGSGAGNSRKTEKDTNLSAPGCSVREEGAAVPKKHVTVAEKAVRGGVCMTESKPDDKGTAGGTETFGAAESKPEDKEELPKLKVMSSREAAAARDSARKKDGSEVSPELVAGAAVYGTESAEDEDSGTFEDTPDALLRRATWNKGLRCRRDYGEYQIPIAFVKAKVAVYVLSEARDIPDEDMIKTEGWTIFRYLESEITDGKEQAEEIVKAVKENLKAERATKKRKAKK